MTLPPNYQSIIESFRPIATKPYLQALAIPISPMYRYWSGILMQGVIPYNMSMVPYFSAPRELSSIQPVAPVRYGSNRIFSGSAPVRGVYTGVKNGS